MSQKSKQSPKPAQRNTMFNYFVKTTPDTAEKSAKIEEKDLSKASGKKLDFGELKNLIKIIHSTN